MLKVACRLILISLFLNSIVDAFKSSSGKWLRFRNAAHPYSETSCRLAAAPGLAELDLRSELLLRFVGDFDNFGQVQQDREKGLVPREGGGHEHIHCCVRHFALPAALSDNYNNDALLAMYYFEGNPSKLFRVRCYTLHGGIGSEAILLKMRLWRVTPAVVAAAAAAAPSGSEAASAAATAALLDTGLEVCTALDGCEVFWAFERSKAQGGEIALPRSLVATMEGGGCLIESEREPGRFIRVEDDLVLTPPRVASGGDDEPIVRATLQINDRGYDSCSGEMVYGNWRGVPYALERVELDNELAWTLGGPRAEISSSPVV